MLFYRKIIALYMQLLQPQLIMKVSAKKVKISNDKQNHNQHI